MFFHAFYTFAADGLLLELTAQAKRYLTLDRCMKRLIPANLQGKCRVACIQNQILIIHADSGAVAAKLRLLASTLLPALQTQGYPIEQIKVKVVMRSVPTIKQKQARISPTGLSNFAAGLEQIQNPMLAQAMRNLIQRQRTD